MVQCVSVAPGSCMQKPTGGKSPGTRRCIMRQCNNPVNIRCLQDTLWIYFHHSYIWQHFDAARLSVPVCFIDLTYALQLFVYSCTEDLISNVVCGQSLNLYMPGRTYIYSDCQRDMEQVLYFKTVTVVTVSIFWGDWSRPVHWVNDLSSLTMLPLIHSFKTICRIIELHAMHEVHIIRHAV